MSELLDFLTNFAGILSTLTVGGVLGSVVGIKYLKRKEAAKAQQEIEIANKTGIENVGQVVDIYKEALEDLKHRFETEESKYKSQLEEYKTLIKEYDQKLKECTTTLEKYEKTITSQHEEIEGLKKEITRLQLLMDQYGIPVELPNKPTVKSTRNPRTRKR